MDEGGTGLGWALLLVSCQRHHGHHVDEGGTGVEWALLLVCCQRHDVIMWTRGVLVWSVSCCWSGARDMMVIVWMRGYWSGVGPAVGVVPET